MTSQIDSHKYGQAVLEHVQRGAYPESEEIISAELPSSVLPQVTKLIEEAREDVKNNIREASKKSAPDIDGWISQAKQLRVDIQKSQSIAQEIVEQARQGEHLEEEANDAASKVDLLNGEIAFNKSLGDLLEQLRAIQRTLDLVQRAALDDNLLEAVDLLAQIDEKLASLSVTTNTRISSVIGAKVSDIRSHVVRKLTDSWNSYIYVDSRKASIQIRQKMQGPSPMNLDSLATALMKLGLFDDTLQSLCNKFESTIIIPRLKVQSSGIVSSVDITADEICSSGHSEDLSARTLFEDLDKVINFLRTQLPYSIVQPLAGLLMPRLISKLTSKWLASAVPESLDGFADFEDTLDLVKDFAETLDHVAWPGKRQLVDWAEEIPEVWLMKRREISLNRVRVLLSQGLGDIETVERVERQVLTHDDEVFTGNAGGDEWNASWSDEETSPIATKAPLKLAETAGGEDEEDVSAWGLDDEDGANTQDDHAQVDTVEDDADTWGWGDDNGNQNENKNEGSRQGSQPAASKPKKTDKNGVLDSSHKPEREITLKEKFNVTSLPREILEIINLVILDAAKLEKPPHASSPVASTAHHLLSLPGLILAMYRASSSITYSRHPSGPMFLYNDSLWLAQRLQDLLPDETTASGVRIQSRNAYNLKLTDHVVALESFGKRAYTKEMESQRTVVSDMLDGAQGFSHCTEHPFNQECDIAVASTIDRLRTLYRQWKDVLSHSALLQSLGSLLSSITNKVIVDIEDMSDISEPESQQLTAYCNRIATLEDLFSPEEQALNPEQNTEQKPIPLTAVYAPHWLKFRYLANILESSLIDIKYLWTEGELGLEFDTEELVDLVVALFADSPHRRTAVAEIRGRRGVK